MADCRKTLSIVSLDYHKQTAQLDARQWANGIYFYSIHQGDKIIGNGKLIKQ